MSRGAAVMVPKPNLIISLQGGISVSLSLSHLFQAFVLILAL